MLTVVCFPKVSCYVCPVVMIDYFKQQHTNCTGTVNTTTTTILRPFFRNHPGEPVPEDYFSTLWCKGRLTEADTPTIRLGATPSGLTSPPPPSPHFLQAGCPSCRPTNSVKALKHYMIMTVISVLIICSTDLCDVACFRPYSVLNRHVNCCTA